MRTLFALIIILLATSLATAQQLLLDINTEPVVDEPVASPKELTTVDGITYFSADTIYLEQGRELWRTDGTDVGTWLVADIAPGSESSNPKDIVDLGDGTLIFAATTALGTELWRSDGTAAGTMLVRDIAAGADSSSPSKLVAFQGKVYFFATDGVTGQELWTTDGTMSGTQLVLDTQPGSSGFVGRVIATPNTLFVASRDPVSFSQFRVQASTDGVNFTSLFVGGPAIIIDSLDFVPFGDLLYFRGGALPWISDGTVAGTYSICDCEFAQDATAAGDVVFFVASTPATGYELWVTDGSEAGTHLVEEVDPGTGNGVIITAMLPIGPGEIVFAGERPDVGRELFVADTTSVSLYADVLPGPFSSRPLPFSTVGSSFVFSTDPSGGPRELYASNGTPGQFDALLNVEGFIPSFSLNGSTLIFAADTTSEGEQLYSTDGTALGTGVVADITPEPTQSSLPSRLVQAGDLGFFFATAPATGRELYVTDGTTAGTQLVADLVPGPDSSVRAESKLVATGDKVVFMVDATPLAAPYVSDGTAAGTFPLATPSADTLISDIDVLDDVAYFFHADAAFGRQLWKSDGTIAGTGMVADISPGVNGVSAGEIVAVGDRIYFTPIVGGVGVEPWVTDGTAVGTMLLMDIGSGIASSYPEGFATFGDKVVFSASIVSVGRELWVSDGTPAGTSLAYDVFPGSTSGDPDEFTELGELLFFNARMMDERRLFVTDATFSSLTELYAWPSALSQPLVALGDRVVFLSIIGSEKGVWTTDGTVAGTTLIVAEDTVWPSAPLGRPGTNDLLAFSGFVPPYTGSFQRRLWVTDGTLAGTQLVPQDVTSPVSTPATLSRLGNQTTVTAYVPLVGTELFTLPLVDTGAYVVETVGVGCAGTGGVPAMVTSGAAADGELFTIGLEDAFPNSLSYLVVSTSVGSIAPSGCALVPDPPILLPLSTDAQGGVSIPFVPDASFIGLRVLAQWATLDPEGEFLNKASLSPGLEVVFGP